MVKLLESDDTKLARALLARGYPYTWREETLLSHEIPAWRTKLREAKERGETFGPTVDADRAETEHQIEEERGPGRAQLVQDLARAVAAREAVVEKIFDTPTARATAANATARPTDGRSSFFLDDPDLKRAKEIADRNEATARENLTSYDLKTDERRRELEAGTK